MRKLLNWIAVCVFTTSIFTWMSCSQDVTIPEDKTAPAEVTNFSVTLENTTASLSWQNPSDDDFAGVQISMTPAEGFLSTPISIGKSSTSFIVTGLKTESTYLFTLKTFDNKLNYSIGVSIQKTVKKDNSSGSSEDKEPEQPKDPIIPDDPENPKEDEPIEPNIDTIPPAQVSDFIAEYSSIETSIRLSWTNPQDKDFAGTEILWGNYNSAEYFTLSFDKSYSSTIISGIAADDSEYFFRICTKDESGNIGESVQTNVVAINDTIPFCDVRTGDFVLKNKTYVRKEYYSELTQYERNQIIGIALVPDSGVPVILGLEFPETGLMWAIPGTTGGNSYFTDIATQVKGASSYGYAITGDLDGSDNWEYISSIDPIGSQNAATTYPAFYFANMYAAVAGLMDTDFANGWYVPSINELYEVSKQFDDLIESINTLGINLPIISELKVGSTEEKDYARFWSSSQSYSLDYSAYVLEGIAEENYGMYAGYYYSYGNFSLENINRGSNAYVWAFHNFDVREIKPYDNYGNPEILDVEIRTVGENYTGKIPVTIYGYDLLSGTITSDNTTFTDVEYVSNTEAVATISNPGYVGEHSITVSCGDSTYNGTYNVALYDDYFKIINIGGEDSGYTIAYPDNSEYQGSFYDTTTSGDYNNYSGNYKSYIESLTFSEAFREKYAGMLYGNRLNITWKEFIENDKYPSNDNQIRANENFDYLITQLNNLLTPVFEDMIETFLTNYEWILAGNNIYGCLKEYEFYVYYVTMILSSYNHGYSGATYNGSKWSDYESSIEDDVIDLWNRLFSEEIFNTTPPIADITSDINNGCPLIVEQMNIHLAYAAEKMQVELTDLQNLLNLSFIIETLEPIGDTSENRDPYYDNPMIKKHDGILSKFFDEYNQ